MLSCPKCGTMLAQIFDMGRGSGNGADHWWYSQDYLCSFCGRSWEFWQDSEKGCGFRELCGPRSDVLDRFWWSHGILMYGANIWEEADLVTTPVDVLSSKIRERHIWATEPEQEPFVINESK